MPFENARCEEASHDVDIAAASAARTGEIRARSTPGYAKSWGHAHAYAHAQARAYALLALAYNWVTESLLRASSAPAVVASPPGVRPITPTDARESRNVTRSDGERIGGHGEVPYDARNRGTSVTGDDATSVRRGEREGGRRGRGRKRKKDKEGERDGRSANTCGSNCPNLTSTGV